jgi:hypothetical protein
MRIPVPARAVFRIVLAVALGAALPVTAADEDWPREIEHPKAKILVYQPQIDDYAAPTIKARAALSLTLKDQKDPIFGALWAEAEAQVDREERVVTISDIKVTRVRFPGAMPEQEKELGQVIEDAAPRWDLRLDYDRFVASLAVLRQSQETAEALRNDPPRIFVETAPAMLLLYDGTPQARPVQGSEIKRVINTPSIVLQDSKGTYYLYGGAGWFKAETPLGPWKSGAKPPKDVKKLVAEMEKQATAKAKSSGEVTPQEDERVLAGQAKKEDPKYDPKTPPKVIAVAEPAELVVFTGEATWKPLVEGELLYADNTSSDVLLEVSTQRNFLLLSGRWYGARTLQGPWEYVPADKVPATFSKIPEDSPKGNVLAHVAGTPQAEEALADAQVPQVAVVKRGPANLQVTYDGAPQFETISGTSIEVARNSPTRVLKMEGKYYACEQGVWYVSDTPSGPWAVADSIPDEVQKIPPDSPAYNVKYVHVYDSTPEVVYVGYTPAYLGCYPYYGTVVWGTGYPYHPWIGTAYYPGPWSFGFHANYNPYAGWSFGFSIGYSWGWGAISFGWGGYGWYGYPPPYWGPGGFYPIYRPPYYPGGYPPYYGNRPTPYASGNRPSTLPAQPGMGTSTLPAQSGGRPSTQPARSGTGVSTLPAGGGGGRAPNLYDRPANRDQVASTRERAGPATRPPAGGGANNVFVNEAGDVFRRNSNGSWDKRTGSGWSSAGGAGQRPQAPSSSLQRDYASRDRGTARYNGFQSGGGYRGGGYAGGMRGGGGGRRR